MLVGSTAHAVYRGTPTDGDRFEAVAWLDSQCTGVLVKRDVLVTAAHCPTPTTASFGTDEPSTVAVSKCWSHPDGGPGTIDDVAICRLAQAPEGVEPFPLVDSTPQGVTGWVVGFGIAEDGDEPGSQRIAELGRVHTRIDGMLEMGGASGSICGGDSGAPVLVRAPARKGEERWAIAGLASGTRSRSCDGTPGVFVPAPRVAALVATSTPD